MASNEVIKAILRSKAMYVADPLTKEADVTTAVWKKLPCTLKDDEVTVSQEDPDKMEVFANEQDAPIYVEYTGKPYRLKGSFVGIDEEALTSLLGVQKGSSGLSLSGDLQQLEKAIKIETFAGKTIILPRAQGSVRLELGLNTGKVSKAPFDFAAKQAGDSWPAAIYFPTK